MILNKDQIYILDDEPGVRKSFETILSVDGYSVKAFSNGTDLIKHIQQITFSAPAVALIDLLLPDMSGINVMHKIKERSPQTEVVMLTGHPDWNSAVEAINAGAYAYILKPYNMDEIKNILSKIFEKQRLVRENEDLTRRLKEWNEKLEEEVYRRTVALQDSYAKLQSLYEMRTQFITIMSHELRTPATALMGFADTLRDKRDQLPQQKVDDYLNIISIESNRMVLLMSEIFEISKIQEGKLKLDLEELEVAPQLAKIVNEFRLRNPTFSFGFTEAPDRTKVKLDPLYFKTALGHIFSNAIKYSPKDGQIFVFTEVRDGRFIIRIEDDGPGIIPEMRQKVFEPFYRSMDDVNRKTPGAGLGLTIARGILDGMQGTIQVVDKRTPKSGAAILVSLPIS